MVFLSQQEQYPVRDTNRMAEDFIEDLGNASFSILVELIGVYRLPKRLYTALLTWIDTCYCRYCNVRYLWLHPGLRARYHRRKRAKGRK